MRPPKGPLNARLATGVGLSFFLSFFLVPCSTPCAPAVRRSKPAAFPWDYNMWGSGNCSGSYVPNAYMAVCPRRTAPPASELVDCIA
jgi:hypothetical protein